MREFLFLIPAMLASTAHAAGGGNVAVIAIGGDADRVAAAQRRFEERIAAVEGVAVRRAADFAAAVGIPDPPAPGSWVASADARTRLSALLADAQVAIFSDRLPDALARLQEASELGARFPDLPVTVRTRLLLLRALARMRDAQADAALADVREAFILAPDLAVPEDLPPELGVLVTRVRASGRKPLRVEVAGVPAGASIRVDDVVVAGAAFSVALPGPHRIEVRKAGYRPWSRIVDVQGETKVTVAMPLQLSSQKALEAVMARPEVTDPDRKGLDALAIRTAAQTLVIVFCGPSGDKILVWSRGAAKARTLSSAPGDMAVLEWLTDELQGITPQASLMRRWSRRSVAIEGGAVAARWSRDVSGRGGSGYSVPGLGGSGPAFRFLWHSGALSAEASASWVTFGSIEARRPDDSVGSVGGGRTVSIRTAGAWQRRLGSNTLGPSIGAAGGLAFESHSAHDLRDASGSLGLFTSHTRLAGDVRVVGSFPVAAIRTTFAAEIGAVVAGSWSESPSGATGRSPSVVPGPAWRVEAAWHALPAGRLSLRYDGEIRSLSYSGAGDSALGLRDVRRTDSIHLLALTWQHGL